MPEDAVEAVYLPPEHLRAEQSVGPFPARFLFPMAYASVYLGLPLAAATYAATNGLLLPAIGAALLPPLAVSPFAAWWLDPPAEHGLAAALGFAGRAWVPPEQPAADYSQVAVWRVQTLNLETASAPLRRKARAQWGSILNGLTHPVKIIIRGRPLTRMPQVEALDRHPLPAAQELGAWFQERLATDRLIERERYLIVPGASDAELRFRADALDNAMRQQRFQAQRVSTDELPLLRTRGWDPRAQEARESPEHLEEGATEMVVDGWWSRTYVMGRLPSAILTNWTSPLFAGDEPIDIAIDLVPKDVADVQHDLEVRVNRLTSSHINVKRRVALEQLDLLAEALERRKVIPFDMQISVLVRGTSRQDVRDRSRLLEERVHSLGARLHVLRWEQAAGLQQFDLVHTRPVTSRATSRAHPFVVGPQSPGRDGHGCAHVPMERRLAATARGRALGRSGQSPVHLHAIRGHQSRATHGLVRHNELGQEHRSTYALESSPSDPGRADLRHRPGRATRALRAVPGVPGRAKAHTARCEGRGGDRAASRRRCGDPRPVGCRRR